MKRATLITTLVALALAAFAPAANAAFGLSEFDVSYLPNEGTPELAAGSHPFEVSTSFALNTKSDPKHGQIPDGAIKDLRVELPPGVVGDPTATQRCSSALFINSANPKFGGICPENSIVGTIAVDIGIEDFAPPEHWVFPLYNIAPAPGTVLKLGFIAINAPITLEATVKQTYPYNVVVTASNTSQAVNLYSAKTTIWGYPGDSAHDPLRGKCLGKEGESLADDCSVSIPERPFITLPRSCGGPIVTKADISSWQDPATVLHYSSASHDSSTPPQPRGISGCGGLGLNADLNARPTTQQAESASGLELGLDVEDPGLISPFGTAQSDIKQLDLALPSGMSANPGLAEGLAACSAAQLAGETLGSAPGQGCPQASKVGTVEAETPLLEDAVLEGDVFLATPDDPATAAPGAENPFDSLLAAYLVLRDPSLGILVKQPVRIQADPVSGQLATIVGQSPNEIPQVPLSHVRTHLRPGPRAPLVTPPACGTYNTTVALTPWANPFTLVSLSSPFAISQGIGGALCPTPPAPFDPQIAAGSSSARAGAYSPFNMRITRRDGEQELSRFSVTLPPGLTAKLVGVGRCSDAAIAAAEQRSGRAELASSSCPAASQVGHVIGGAGVGQALTYVSGGIYLAGPFDGAPLSVVTIVPAVAGPFDVGTVVTRLALRLDPNTGIATTDGSHATPIPHILRGVPVRLREVRAYIDRPNFALNPTNCEPLAVKAQISGLAPVERSAFYQASDCATLKFKPQLKLNLKGGTTRGSHPALKGTVTYPKGSGYANLKKAVITLPPTEFIDNAHIQNPCTRVQFNADQCPKGSVLGTARATTPLLDEPLEGPVYFRSNGGERLLPDIVADLHGLFDVTVVGFVDSRNGRIRTTFQSVPDAPVSKVTISLYGGKRGLLVNSRNLCTQTNRAKVQLTAQNSDQLNSNPPLTVSCPKQKRAAKRRR